MKKFNKKRGLTLIEIIIAMAIMAIIGGVVTTMTISNNKILSKVDMKSELQMEGQIIQTQLTNVALESKGIYDVDFIENTDQIRSIMLDDGEYLHEFIISGNELIYQKLKNNDILQKRILSSNISTIQVIPSIEDDLIKSDHMEFNINLSMKRGTEIVNYHVDNYIVFRNFKKEGEG
ncbi:prepilin-type N-terminal cleavage/methylation domain-containing protein [Turicibacter sp. TJ11]|uniref:prepilin-type N-terminal cleavage/methylation domain-containing protein n=1 Tax=Turicibacter sp. TJ11 TaxID=2806443 RepID=UPI001F3C9FEA|nr:prepilin-type N-terminal cleavage/methylation domain-containing protein [Turicibacter sp. TJ11]